MYKGCSKNNAKGCNRMFQSIGIFFSFIVLSFMTLIIYITFRMEYITRIRNRWIDEDHRIGMRSVITSLSTNTVRRTRIVSQNSMLCKNIFRFNFDEYEIGKWDK